MVESQHRLHLGASSLELLNRTPTREFIHESWLHLGDEPEYNPRSDTGTLKSKIRAWGKRMLIRSGYSAHRDASLYDRTTFSIWVFKSGDKLPFPDESFDFIYSEHFFEHLRFDTALELLREIQRVLRGGGGSHGRSRFRLSDI